MKNMRKINIFILIIFLIIIIIGFNSLNIKFDVMKELFLDKEFVFSIICSLKISLLATILSTILGVPIGLFLSRIESKMVKSIVDIIIYIPIVLPPIVVGIILLTIFNVKYIKDIFIFSTPGIIIAQFIIAFPLLIIIAKNSFDIIPRIYERVATTFGKNKFEAFIDTTFKMSLTNILSGMILVWLRCMGEFGATLIVGGGIAYKTRNIPISIYFNIQNGDINKAIAISILSIFIAMISILIMRFFIMKNNINNSN